MALAFLDPQTLPLPAPSNQAKPIALPKTEA
jgi:hypothetical protein